MWARLGIGDLDSRRMHRLPETPRGKGGLQMVGSVRKNHPRNYRATVALTGNTRADPAAISLPYRELADRATRPAVAFTGRRWRDSYEGTRTDGKWIINR